MDAQAAPPHAATSSAAGSVRDVVEREELRARELHAEDAKLLAQVVVEALRAVRKHTKIATELTTSRVPLFLVEEQPHEDERVVPNR